LCRDQQHHRAFEFLGQFRRDRDLLSCRREFLDMAEHEAGAGQSLSVVPIVR
jgi:hypothetical protein